MRNSRLPDAQLAGIGGRRVAPAPASNDATNDGV
jgi:hypothetical protein